MSEVELQGELYLPGMAAGSRASDGSLTAGATTLEGIWRPEVDIVRQIEEFRPELQISGFRSQWEVLLQRQIPVAEAGAPENAIPGISKDVKCRRGEAAWVVVVSDGPMRERTATNTVRYVTVSVVQVA